MEKKTALRLMLIYSILFMALFTIFFVSKGNYEFLYYTALMAVVILFFVLFYKNFNFPVLSMLGLTILLTLHILGGHIDIGNVRLYDYWFIDGVLKYDNLVHFFGIFTVTFMINHIIRPHLNKNIRKSTWFFYLILMSLGVAGFYEVLELIPAVWLGAANQVGDYINNALDLVFGLLGSCVASFYLVNKKR
ncbi:MAG: DUF2238 domain-containing protein [Candidatus Nanoarchaeia archaeon]|nr:DUF2238 domain-containing protein [Candidatus Nanoarchaeia archaeon]